MVDFAGIKAAAEAVKAEANKGITAASKILTDNEPDKVESLSAAEAKQVDSSASEEDPFEKARQDAEDEYNKPGPTEADVPVTRNENYSNEGRGSSGNVLIASPSKKEIDYVPLKEIRQNPLHQFATYTYSISLYILTPADINQLTKSPNTWVPGAGGVNTCLIASGGKNSGPYKRNEHFKDDFYFDNLQMTTVIGLNNRSKASNAIEVSFSVIEPYGMSLLDRVMAAANSIKAPNFKAMPYLLEIDFYGQTDDGKSVKLTNQRKRIPIQIIEFKIKVNTKGSEYAIKAVPWNHQALSQSAATTPINIEVAAATVEEFFANNEQDYESVAKQDEAKSRAADDNKALENTTTNETPRPAGGGRGGQGGPTVAQATGKDTSPVKSARTPAQASAYKENQEILRNAYAVKSFCGGMNGWFIDLTAKRLRATTDKIYVKFHGSKEVPVEKLTQSKITVPERKDISRSATTTSNPKEAVEASEKSKKAFGDAMAFPIAAGTSVLQVIDMVMRNSSYVTDQISDPKDTKPADIAEKMKKPLYWYKVIPSVEAGEYDFAVNKFSTKTTYHIVPYIVYDSKHPNGPITKPKGAIKEYNYSYTGKNLDVIDLQIDFDTLYYTAVTAGSAKWQADQIQKAKEQLDEAQRAASASSEAAKALVNRQLRLVSTQPQQQGLGGQQGSAEQILAADIQKSQYSNSRGDMLNLKLKIVGDPELIKQDDIYTNPAQADSWEDQLASGVMSDNGSIPMDSGEVIAQVNFRTIVDMDETTGLPRAGEYANKSVFTGFYRMLTVSNTFQGGKFEQTIDMIRVPDIPEAKDTKVTPENKNPNAAAGSREVVGTGASGADMDAFYDMGEVTPAAEPEEDRSPTDEDVQQYMNDNPETDPSDPVEEVDWDNTEAVPADDWWADGTNEPLDANQIDSEF